MKEDERWKERSTVHRKSRKCKEGMKEMNEGGKKMRI